MTSGRGVSRCPREANSCWCVCVGGASGKGLDAGGADWRRWVCQASKGEQVTPGDFLGGPRGVDSTTPGGRVSEGSSQSRFRSTVNERHVGALERGAG